MRKKFCTLNYNPFAGYILPLFYKSSYSTNGLFVKPLIETEIKSDVKLLFQDKNFIARI